MNTILIDFSVPYLGTVAKQGEHNKTELVFTLPEGFENVDYVNAEFERPDGTKPVVTELLPENGTVTVPITQDITVAKGTLHMQLVGYEVDGNDVKVIAKTDTVRGNIEDSIEATEPADKNTSLFERLQAWLQDARDKLAALWELRHTHVNKATLDSLFYYDAEHPPAAYDPDNPIQMPTIDLDTSKRYLRVGEKYVRKTEDGGVITRVTTTTKKGKKYLRFTFNWDPDLFLDLEAGRSVAGRPMYVDIPVEEVNSQQGGNTLELDLGLNSIGEEIIEIQDDLSVSPDWNENDTTKRAYIANRTHWKATEAITSYQTYVYGIDEDGVGKERNGNQFEIEPDAEYTFTFSGQEYVRSSFPVILDENNERIFIADDINQEGRLFYCVGNTEVFQNGQIDAARIAEYIPGENELPFIVFYTPIEGYTTLQTLGPYSDDELSITVQAVTINETIHKLSEEYLPDDVNDAAQKKHAHENKTVLDEVSNQTLVDVAANTLARHSHGNKPELDLLGTKGIWTPNGTYYTVTYNTTPVNGVQFFYPQAISENCYNTYLYAGMIVKIVEPVNGGSITISSFVGGSPFYEVEYALEFTTGATAPSLSLPSNVKFQNELTIEPNKHYQISIVNNIALWCAVDVEVSNA